MRRWIAVPVVCVAGLAGRPCAGAESRPSEAAVAEAMSRIEESYPDWRKQGGGLAAKQRMLDAIASPPAGAGTEAARRIILDKRRSPSMRENLFHLIADNGIGLNAEFIIELIRQARRPDESGTVRGVLARMMLSRPGARACAPKELDAFANESLAELRKRSDGFTRRVAMDIAWYRYPKYARILEDMLRSGELHRDNLMWADRGLATVRNCPPRIRGESAADEPSAPEWVELDAAAAPPAPVEDGPGNARLRLAIGLACSMVLSAIGLRLLLRRRSGKSNVAA